jgi:hypothetical protein
MPTLTAISKEQHADKSWHPIIDYQFAAKDNLVPIAGAEIALAAQTLPTAFIKHQDRYILMAVLSFAPGSNLFVAPDGQWRGEYVPAVFRTYPFALARAQGQDNPVLCVDEDSGLVNDDKNAGELFFDDTGEIAPALKKNLEFISRVARNRAATDTAVTALSEAGVITDWPVTLTAQDQKRPVKGLYRIDEEKLNQLPDETFLTLRRSQALAIAYGQLLSMGNIQKLGKLAQDRDRDLKSPLLS